MAKLLLVGLVVVMVATLRVAPPQGRLVVGEPLPALSGHFLTGDDATLPEASSGMVRLVAIGFTYQSRFPVEAWAGWFRTEFGQRADVTFFEVPMISGVARFGQWFIDRGMRSGTPAALHENVITVYEGAGAWKVALDYGPGREDDAYVIVLDGNGVVRWLYHGMFDDVTASQLRDVIVSVADRDAETHQASKGETGH